MKVGIVGSGYVGATTAFALLLSRVASEIVLIDLDRARAEAEAADILHAVPFVHPAEVRAGNYPDLTGSKVVIVAAGVAQKPGETRLQLLGRNAKVFQQIIPEILRFASGALLLIATNPVDIMTHLAARYASELGVPATRVIGSGTTLDTARFRSLLGAQLGVDARHVHGYVVGEHGDSEVLTWSIVDIGGLPLDAYIMQRGVEFREATRKAIDDQVRNAAYLIINGKGATNYGVAAAMTHIVDVIAHDHRSILTICTLLHDFAGEGPVTLSLPHLVGGEGVLDTLELQLSEEESQALYESARIIRETIESLDRESET